MFVITLLLVAAISAFCHSCVCYYSSIGRRYLGVLPYSYVVTLLLVATISAFCHTHMSLLFYWYPPSRCFAKIICYYSSIGRRYLGVLSYLCLLLFFYWSPLSRRFAILICYYSSTSIRHLRVLAKYDFYVTTLLLVTAISAFRHIHMLLPLYWSPLSRRFAIIICYYSSIGIHYLVVLPYSYVITLLFVSHISVFA